MERYCNIGFDICKVPRVQRKIHRGLFVVGNFTDPEIVYCEAAKEPLRSERYAARWSAKEAVTKALGHKVPFTDIFVLHQLGGDPFIYLEGKARDRAEMLGVNRILISISHGQQYAGAVCLAFDDRRQLSEDALQPVLHSFNLLQTALKGKIPIL